MSEEGGFRTGDQRGEMLGKIPLSHPLFLPYFIELQQFLLSKNKQDTSQKWYMFYAIFFDCCPNSVKHIFVVLSYYLSLSSSLNLGPDLQNKFTPDASLAWSSLLKYSI